MRNAADNYLHNQNKIKNKKRILNVLLLLENSLIINNIALINKFELKYFDPFFKLWNIHKQITKTLISENLL